jgi:hypothetical protein
MKKFFQKQKELIIIIAYVGIVLILVYFVILPLLLKIKEVNNKIQEESIKQEIAKQQLAELPKIQQQYDILQANEGTIDVLLDKDKAVTLIESLEKLAEDSGNKIEIFVQNSQLQKNVMVATTKTKTEDTLLNALPSSDYLQMQIVLTGDYNKIINFISRLENMEYYSDITGIKITQNDFTGNIEATSLFGSVSINNSNKVSDKSNPENLKATLDVVFYTKK